ncbi:uncharacterized protein LOC62_04G005288 [Vanrija pseudolonga]|uniref:Uncharacterized protein n=1 Tax=Vanrija pseudolonga TaxID=143232 RepID=A0AAF0YC69_9TREE|nr:hypothetical protein LOC62_04G005288 [Vanrija pseudolonga]
MTVIIDHTAFPAIVEKIIDAADFGTQLKFRGTSKAYCSHVNKIHFKHLLVRMGEGPDEFLNGSELPWISASASGPARPTVLNATEIVDVCVLSHLKWRIEVLRHLPSAHTIRRLALNCTLYPITHLDNLHTVVDFVNTVVSAEEGAANLAMIDVSYDLEHQIIHLRWKDDRIVPYLIFQGNTHAPKLQEVVIALWPVNTDETPKPEVLWSMVVDFAAYVKGSVALKIVGMEKLDFGSNIGPHDLDRRTVAFFKGIANRLGPFRNPAQVLEKITGFITLRTFEQWWQEHGEHKDIHGTWNPLSEVEGVDDEETSSGEMGFSDDSHDNDEDWVTVGTNSDNDSFNGNYVEDAAVAACIADWRRPRPFELDPAVVLRAYDKIRFITLHEWWDELGDMKDLVIAHCSVAGLVALRGASREYQAIADAILFQHVVMREHPYGGCSLALHDSSRLVSDRPLPQLPEKARTLDKVTVATDAPATVITTHTTLRPHTLRRFGGHVHNDIETEYADVTVDFFPASDSTQEMVWVPSGTRRYVVHYDWEWWGIHSDNRDIRASDELKEVVLVLPGNTQPRIDMDDAVFGIGAELARLALRGSSLTIVGFEKWYEVAWDTVHILWDGFIEHARLDVGNMPEQLGAAEKRTRLVSLAEWCAELGDRVGVDGPVETEEGTMT